MTQDRDGTSIEEKVAELEATVGGLTDELVDAKERIKELEVEAGLREEKSADLDEDMTVEELFEAADDDPIAEETEESEESAAGDQEVVGDDIIVG